MSAEEQETIVGIIILGEKHKSPSNEYGQLTMFSTQNLNVGKEQKAIFRQ